MTLEQNSFQNLLKSRGHFVTKPREHLFMTLQKHPEITVKHLISLLDEQDQATVYRNILLFEELGIINRLRLGWHSKLELSDLFHEHHHHATCTVCGKVYALGEDPEIERNLQQLAARNNFTLESHTLEIRGRCPACRL